MRDGGRGREHHGMSFGTREDPSHEARTEGYNLQKGAREMTRMTVRSRVGADGVLHVTVPVSPADANQEVQVTIEPVGPPPMTQEEWRAFVLSMAGSITDP